MKRASVSRRAALLALGGVAFIPFAANAYEVLQPLAGDSAGLRFKAIRIDVSPLAENGNGPAAAWLAQDLREPLQAAFAARMAPRDPHAVTLLVRIDRITLGMQHSVDRGFGHLAPDAADDIQGACVILGSNGRPNATYPVSSVVQAYSDGPGFDFAGQRNRVQTLAQSFAQWLPGQMGL
jgi:hypothetical protein